MSTSSQTTGAAGASRPRSIADLDVKREELEAEIAQLRACQSDPALCEQRHQFCDIDPDLANRDYWTGAAA